jgi:rubrerythrin
MKRKNEKGFALVLSLVLLMVMSLLGGSLIVITSTDHQSNNSSDEYQQAFYVAETALLEAEKSVINRMMGPWVNADTAFVDVPTGMTEGEREEWDSMVENIQTAAVAGLARNTDRRDLPSNLIAATDTPCFNSFRNISRAGFLVTDHQVNKNFGTLIQAIFLQDGDLDDLTTADIIAKEKVYMERFRYEYFITNIGAAEYKGAGSSLKKTSTMTQGSGTAYKIYGCGYLMPDKTAPDDFDDPDILVPLEAVIVLSN